MKKQVLTFIHTPTSPQMSGGFLKVRLSYHKKQGLVFVVFKLMPYAHFIQGRCEAMCSDDEIAERDAAHDISLFEVTESTRELKKTLWRIDPKVRLVCHKAEHIYIRVVSRCTSSRGTFTLLWSTTRKLSKSIEDQQQAQRKRLKMFGP